MQTNICERCRRPIRGQPLTRLARKKVVLTYCSSTCKKVHSWQKRQ